MPDINTLLKLLTDFVWLGNWLFFTLAFVESAPFIGVFMPGATFISIGGFLASTGVLKAWDIVIYASLGAIFGDFFSYSLGRWGGKWINEKKLINKAILEHGENFFYKYGNISIFWGRFFGPLRAVVPFVAGVSKMKYRPFIFWNLLSGVLWAILNVSLGYFSGAIFIKIFNRWSNEITLVLIILFIVYIVYRLNKKGNKNIATSFRINSEQFILFLYNKKWFNYLSDRYPFIPLFFKESKHAAEKLFAGVIVFPFLIIVYLLTLMLDIF